MKTGDILPQKEQIGKVVSYIIKNLQDGQTILDGVEIKNKHDYDFISDALIVTIDKNIEPPANSEYKVDEFWGNQIRIDIAAKGLDKKEIRNILKKAFDEYIDVFNRKTHKYDTL